MPISTSAARRRFIYNRTNHNGFGVYGLSTDAVISGVISGSGGITYIAQDNNTGTSPMESPLILNAANTFTGMLEIDRGSIYLNNPDALDKGNVLFFNPAAGNNARLFLWGNNAVVSDLSSAGVGTTVIANGNRPTGNSSITLAPVTLTVTQNNAGTFRGTIIDSLLEYSNSGASTVGGISLVKQGPATLTLAGSYPASGSVTISAGTLSFPSAASFPSSFMITLDGGTLQYIGPALDTNPATYQLTVTANGGTVSASGSGPLNLDTAGSVIFSGATPTTLTLSGSNTGQNTLAAVLADGAGATSLTKTGLGTWDLAGADTYTGPTMVSAGELLVDGSLTSPVTVAGGATLGGAASATAGTGTISAPVIVNGTLIAGDVGSTGLLTVGDLSFGAGGAYGPTLGGTTAGTGYDQVTGTGTINLNNAALNVSIAAGFTPTIGSTYDILVDNGPGASPALSRASPRGERSLPAVSCSPSATRVAPVVTMSF